MRHKPLCRQLIGRMVKTNQAINNLSGDKIHAGTICEVFTTYQGRFRIGHTKRWIDAKGNLHITTIYARGVPREWFEVLEGEQWESYRRWKYQPRKAVANE